GAETAIINNCSAFMEQLSKNKASLMNICGFLRTGKSAIIGNWAKNWTSSLFPRKLDRVCRCGCLKGQLSVVLLNAILLILKNVLVMTMCTHLFWAVLICIKQAVIGIITRMTC